MAKVGRPSDYTPELADSICERLAAGESMRSVSRDDKMPAMSTLFKWIRELPEFTEQYAIAKTESADALVEDMLDIADNQVDQPLLVDGIPLEVDGKVVKVKDAVSVNHARLRVDTRKWAASKLKPKKYGDKIAIGGDAENPFQLMIKEISGFTLEPSKDED
tara:strand:- start:656 stop:1141 length:486 start_codon:yes stop_codon:yes gene_type:complete